MLTREVSHSIADQYLTNNYKAENALFYDLPPPPNNNALGLDSNDDTNVTYTKIFIEE